MVEATAPMTLDEPPATGEHSRWLSGPRKVTCRRGLALATGCMMVICASPTLVAYVYLNALKDTFKLSQTQAGLACALSVIGVNSAFVPGIVAKQFGTRKCLLSGIVISALGHFLLYGACAKREFYQQHSGLITFYLFLMGLGTCFGYYMPLGICFQSFHPVHRGKVIGLIVSVLSVGKVLFATIYNSFFVNGHVRDADQQNLAGFVLTSGIAMIVALLWGVAFLRIYPPGCEAEGYEELPDSESDRTGTELNITGFQLFKRADFHLLCWQLILSGSAVHMFVDNMVVYMRSLYLSDYIMTVTVLSPVIQVVSTFLSGLVSDYTRHHLLLPRIVFLLTLHSAQAIILVVCVFYADKIHVFLVALILVSMSFGAIYTLTPTIMSEHFGHANLLRDYGFAKVSMSIVSSLLAIGFGALYSREITDPTSEDCYGLKCFTSSFVIVICLTIVTIILNAISTYQDWRTLRTR